MCDLSDHTCKCNEDSDICNPGDKCDTSSGSVCLMCARLIPDCEGYDATCNVAHGQLLTAAQMTVPVKLMDAVKDVSHGL